VCPFGGVCLACPATDRGGFSVRAKSNTETVSFTAPVSGTYYVRLTGTYAGLTLVARQ